MQVITLFVTNKERCKQFYQTVFGFPLYFEDDDSIVFEMENILLNFLIETAAPEVIAPARVASRKAGSRMLFTVHVEDVDARCAKLKAQGIPLLLEPIDRPWGVRTANLSDPDGHMWEIASPLPPPDSPRP